MLFSNLNVHIFHSCLVKSELMGKSIRMSDFAPQKFEPIIPVWLEDMIALLMNVFSALIIKVINVDSFLTFQKGFTIFPIMHGINKNCLKLVNCMIKPKNISEIVLVDSSKVDFVIVIMCGFNDIQKLLRNFIVFF